MLRTHIAAHNKKKQFFAMLFSMAALFGIFAVSTRVSLAATSTVGAKQNQLDVINQKIQTYQNMVALKQKEQTYLSNQIQSLDAQSQKISQDINTKQDTISSLDDQIRVLEGKISEKTDTIDQQRKILAELLRSYYSQQSVLDPATSNTFLIASPEQVKTGAQVSDWTGDVSVKISDLTDNIISLRQSLVDEQNALRDNRAQIENARFQLEQQNQYLDSTKQNKTAVLATSQAAEKQYTGIISDLEQQREDIEQEIQTLEQAKVDQLDLSKLPKFGTSLFIYPVTNPRQSQGYGKVGTSFANKSYSNGFHNGLDFADATGTPIYAAAAGTVIGVGDCGKYAYGKWVAIDHGNGLVTLYGHMSKQVATKGQVVTQGKQIGLMGETGFATGPHVHFTVFAQNSFDVVESKKVPGIMIPTGTTVNPKNYLP